MKITKTNKIHRLNETTLHQLSKQTYQEDKADFEKNLDLLKNDPDLKDDNKQDGVDKIQTAAEIAGKQISDKEAQKVLNQAQGTAKKINAEKIGIYIPRSDKDDLEALEARLDSKSDIIQSLDDCYKKAQKVRDDDYLAKTMNVCIVGIPGAGKTAVVETWCKTRGLYMFALDAKDRELGASISGYPTVKELETTEGQKTLRAVRAWSTALEPLWGDDPTYENSVLFLDELNRQEDEGLRGCLLELVNNRRIPGPGEHNHVICKNMLFTIACINPYTEGDTGAHTLGSAERDRFKDVQYDSTREDAYKYYMALYKDGLSRINIKHKDWVETALTHYREYTLLKAILNEKSGFDFTSRKKYMTFGKGQGCLSKRSLHDFVQSTVESGVEFPWVDARGKVRGAEINDESPKFIENGKKWIAAKRVHNMPGDDMGDEMTFLDANRGSDTEREYGSASITEADAKYLTDILENKWPEAHKNNNDTFDDYYAEFGKDIPGMLEAAIKAKIGNFPPDIILAVQEEERKRKEEEEKQRQASNQNQGRHPGGDATETETGDDTYSQLNQTTKNDGTENKDEDEFSF